MKSSALLNAVFVCLVVSIFCSTMLLLASYNKIYFVKLNDRENLILNNFWKADLDYKNYLIENNTHLHDQTITTQVNFEDWGILKIKNVESINLNDTLNISKMMAGGSSNQDSLCSLYLTDRDEPLKLGGATLLRGNIYIPNRITENFYHPDLKNKIILNGEKFASNKNLPVLKNKNLLDSLIRSVKTTELLSFDHLKNYNSFSNDIKIYKASGYLPEAINLRGKIILYSEDHIIIKKDMKLEDVIMIAPKITFEDDFSGTVQAFATQFIKVGQKVNLQYPSVLYGFANDTINISIGKKSTVAGAIILNGDTYKGSLKRKLQVREEALIIGDIYIYGTTELYGNIHGTLYTDKLNYNKQNINNDNTLINSVIDITALPSNFKKILTFENTESYEVIKSL